MGHSKEFRTPGSTMHHQFHKHTVETSEFLLKTVFYLSLSQTHLRTVRLFTLLIDLNAERKEPTIICWALVKVIDKYNQNTYAEITAYKLLQQILLAKHHCVKQCKKEKKTVSYLFIKEFSGILLNVTLIQIGSQTHQPHL